MASSMATATATTVYKGKVTHRSWPQLPPELVRTIATYYLLDVSRTSYCPQTWDSREAWHHRMVYTALRDASDLERHMMSICPQWHLALQNHLFWNQAIALIDPTDALGNHQFIAPKGSSQQSTPIKISPFQHFHNITRVSCFVCRINAPNSTLGLANAKRLSRHPYFLTIPLCREHDRRPVSYCGLCLRVAPVYEPSLVAAHLSAAAQHEHIIAIVENDDKDSFPNVEATCRACRTEWLWKRAQDTPGDREAIGGNRFEPQDWEARNAVDSYIDLAEGSIGDVLTVAREKLWLRKNTRLEFMMKMLKKTNRVDSEGLEGLERYYNENEEEEDPESDISEDDIELLQIEESHVKDMALGDWARARILDGHWISPADTWYQHIVNGYKDWVPAVHPCPWTCEPMSPVEDDGEDDEDAEVTIGEDGEKQHPLPATLRSTIPPTFALCEQAFSAHQRQLKEILVPPMKNLVRKIVIECQTPGMTSGPWRGGEDPAIRAAKMSMEDVLRELRNEEGIWLNGFDWVQRCQNERERQRQQRELERERERAAHSDDSHSPVTSAGSSSGSVSSNSSSSGTSPVLSTTTLQTTPSPPPIVRKHPNEDEAEAAREASRPSVPLISVDPVEEPPRPIHTVPHIPITSKHFPPYTMDGVKLAWREACAPLYRCRCSICLRAAAKAQAQQASHRNQQAQKIVVPSQAVALPPPPPPPPSTIQRQAQTQRPLSLEMDGVEVIDVDAEGEGEEEEEEGEDEVHVVREEEEEEEDEEDGQPPFDFDDLESITSADIEVVGDDEEDPDHDADADADADAQDEEVVEIRNPHDIDKFSSLLAPRPRKRSSDEIDFEVEGEGLGQTQTLSREVTPPKRARTTMDLDLDVRLLEKGGLSLSSSRQTLSTPPSSASAKSTPTTTTTTTTVSAVPDSNSNSNSSPPSPLISPPRIRKRSSEELDDVERDGGRGEGERRLSPPGSNGNKKIKVLSVSLGHHPHHHHRPSPSLPPLALGGGGTTTTITESPSTLTPEELSRPTSVPLSVSVSTGSRTENGGRSNSET